MFKFGVYLTIPVLTVMFFNTPEAIKALIEKKQYIVYPPEGPRPIRGSKEEIGEFLGIKPNADANKRSTKPPAGDHAQAEKPKSWWRFGW